jgi:NhaP-type Na+/H+ or K+/H+ antiporter
MPPYKWPTCVSGPRSRVHAGCLLDKTDKGVHHTMIGVLIAVLLAALVYALCAALGLPGIVAIVAAILVLLAGIPSGGYGLGRRF